jgi:FkbM family methyltransferase
MTTDALGAKKRIEVQVYSIADLITQKKLPPPGFVKIDVEGRNWTFFKGSRIKAARSNAFSSRPMESR